MYPTECSIPEDRKEREESLKVNKAEKQRKTIGWERLEIYSRKLKITNGTFCAKMGTIKDRNGKDLTEAEKIKNR